MVLCMALAMRYRVWPGWLTLDTRRPKSCSSSWVGYALVWCQTPRAWVFLLEPGCNFAGCEQDGMFHVHHQAQRFAVRLQLVARYIRQSNIASHGLHINQKTSLLQAMADKLRVG